MKKRGPSNHFVIPKWMQSLRIHEPEGTKTPDQVAKSLELNLAWNDSDPAKLRACIKLQVPLVPLKHQKVLKAFLAMDDTAMLESVSAFINKANDLLADIVKVEVAIEPERKEVCPEPSGESQQHPVAGWEDDWGSSRRSKPSTRGHRALRAAKRGQAEA